MMMTCDTARNLLALRADDWNAGESREVEAHVQFCPDCAALARSYAEQDRLMQVSPRVRLTTSQRDQLLVRVQRSGRRYKMHARVFTVLGTAAAALALIVLGLGLFALFQGQDPPAEAATAVGLESPVHAQDELTTNVAQSDAESLIAMVAARFADEIGITGLSVQYASGKLASFVPEQLGADEPVLLGRLQAPTDIRLTLNWRLMAPRSADWRIFVHVMNETGELALQSDAEVDWPAALCTEGENGAQCTVASEHEWVFSEDFQSGTYTVVVGLYDPVTGGRAPVTEPMGATSSVVLGQMVFSESHVFAGEIRNLDVGTRFPSSLGVQIGAAPSDLGAFTVPADVGVVLGWQVVARPSARWQVFVHLVHESGAMVLQSDVDVDWPERPCAEPEFGLDCIVTSTHELALPVGFPPGTYAIVAGLYDPATGQRAPVTSPTGVTPPQIELGRVRVLADAASTDVVRSEIRSPIPSTPPAVTSPVLPELGGEFAIYLTAEDLSPQLLSQADLSSLELEEQPVLSSAEILHYSTDTHEIELTQTARERINQLPVSTAGRSFVVTVGDVPIYAGAFWTLASSLTFDGVVVEVPLIDASMRIQLGYPESLDLFSGQDSRSDVRVLQALDQAGKLE